MNLKPGCGMLVITQLASQPTHSASQVHHLEHQKRRHSPCCCEFIHSLKDRKRNSSASTQSHLRKNVIYKHNQSRRNSANAGDITGQALRRYSLREHICHLKALYQCYLASVTGLACRCPSTAAPNKSLEVLTTSIAQPVTPPHVFAINWKLLPKHLVIVGECFHRLLIINMIDAFVPLWYFSVDKAAACAAARAYSTSG